MSLSKSRLLPALALACLTASASAVTSFTETFNTNASNWLNGASAAPTYSSTGGVSNSGFVSYTSTFSSAATGSFGASPLQILFRGNSGSSASGGAFTGNWITSGVESITVSVRHNYTTSLNLYARLDAGSGRAASLADTSLYAVAPNTWTTISIPIVDTNPPFLSYGAGTFSTVFSNIQNVQLGFYLPASTTFTNFEMAVDNIAVTVPEPASFALAALGLGALTLRRRSRAA